MISCRSPRAVVSGVVTVGECKRDALSGRDHLGDIMSYATRLKGLRLKKRECRDEVLKRWVQIGGLRIGIRQRVQAGLIACGI